MDPTGKCAHEKKIGAYWAAAYCQGKADWADADGRLREKEVFLQANRELGKSTFGD